MALAQRSNTRRTIILAAALGVVLIAGGVYLYIQNKPDETIIDPSAILVNASQNLPIISTFSDTIFDDPRFQDLVFRAPQEITIGNLGKDNPFQPTF
ncbi:MAG: hypothetical protein WCV86_04245 [Patescibacteria group bacterium]|jgi:hypothetical protein